ncbi:MAG: hypothetical protein HFG27_08475 [Provencibacterium sp.]|jgi:hypothetical protein|nr:hypothetical protein [Provencibacterium sp.]
MKRLTVRTPKGAALKMDDTYPNKAAAREDLMRRYRIAVERLAAYEDIGLMPEEIIAPISSLNIPLTLEDLLEMDGEPVWVCDFCGTHGGYMLVSVCGGGCIDYAEIAYFTDFGKEWLAYRRRPEK